MQVASPLTRSGNIQITDFQTTHNNNSPALPSFPSFPINLQHFYIRSENKSLDLENYLDRGIIPPTRDAKIQVASLCAKYYIRHGEPKLKEALSYLIETGKVDTLTFSNELCPKLFHEQSHIHVDVHFHRLIQLLNEHKTVISLSIVKCNFNASYVASILENTKIQHLNVPENYFNYLIHNGGEEAGTIISKALRNNTTLKTLDLSGNKIGALGIKEICTALYDNHTLTKLNLSDNQLGQEGAESVANMINRTSIENLILNQNYLGSVGGKKICDALHHNKTVKQLSLRENFLEPNSKDGHMAAQAIANLLAKNNPYLEEIDISDNRLYSLGSSIIFDALTMNKTLKKIHFFGCQIGKLFQANSSEDLFDDEIYGKIACMLKVNTHLETLDFGKNAFGPGGLYQVMKALIENKTLRNLLLGYQHRDFKELCAIAYMLMGNKGLLSLSLAFSSIDSNSVKVLAAALKRSNLESIDFYGNFIGDGKHDLAVALVEGALNGTSSLRNMGLERNLSDPNDEGDFDQNDTDIQEINFAFKYKQTKSNTYFLSEPESNLLPPSLGELLDPVFPMRPFYPRMNFTASHKLPSSFLKGIQNGDLKYLQNLLDTPQHKL